MEKPSIIIRRICDELGYQPSELLEYLLSTLADRHMSLTQCRTAALNVFTDLGMALEAAGREADAPASLLGVIDLIMEEQQRRDRAAVEYHRDNPEYTKWLERKITGERVLQMVLRALMSQAEMIGMIANKAVDEIATREGWNFDPEPHADDDPDVA